MRLTEISCPFTLSKIKKIVYHGSRHNNILKFNRIESGVWFAESKTWAQNHYANNGYVYKCYIDCRNPYLPTEEEIEQYYGEEELLKEFFQQLKLKGYDSYIQGGESGSIAVFDTVKILNIETKKLM